MGDMGESNGSSKLRTAVGFLLLILGIAVFVVRLQHEGAYAMPRGGNLLGGLGSLVLGCVLLWSAAPRLLRWVGLAVSPVIFFFGLYATMAELEETISLYATNSTGKPAELRLWIVDREDGEWVGMPRSKAVEHSLDGAELQLLRKGETRCVVPVLYEDREIVTAIHALKVEKYAVARASAAVGFYPREAKETTVALRFDSCPES